ncbi:TnsA endonuclease N-terminal domain-containing protein [Variovorax sp. J2P1-59]|uniref:TnsA endonuclease N-terminal domain-containing protein n=1 Tax=Variovorax flavidus TaxID=3053501 RepID=UPI00257834FA|nr:TnsA endonuclease N-terminal domain-containing protein [Variovorax sp. J2P1-59]MDM0077030.1 TnsA endonuclease N-terminal domain-containing protein [Variovorax sp. J2P1-59]
MGKRFTPKLLARFARERRGEGTYANYVPYHKVARGDPSSSGRSNLLMFRNRLRHLLSDGELGQQYFAAMLPGLDDCVEQFKLTLEPSAHPLAAYSEHDALTLYPGTLALAAELGMKHPWVYGDGQNAPWKASTDLVLVFRRQALPREMLALSFKPNGWSLHERTIALLRLEREYWVRRGVKWLLITPEIFDKRVALTMRRTAAWALTDPASEEQRAVATQLGCRLNGYLLQEVLQELQQHLGSMEVAQLALWQSVWRGDLPLDLSRGWRPHLPIVVLTPQAFWAQNPIASQRSAWLWN